VVDAHQRIDFRMSQAVAKQARSLGLIGNGLEDAISAAADDRTIRVDDSGADWQRPDPLRCPGLLETDLPGQC